jgi:hypothetical protein
MDQLVIKLDENYRIECDTYNYHLKYSKVGEINEKTGKPSVSNDEWYFPRLSQALNRYFNQAMKSAADIEELKEEISRVEKIISGIKNIKNA